MKNIILVTGNERKFLEAQMGCQLYGIEVVRKQLEILEIQSSDPHEVSKHKAKSAFAQLQQPLTVTDSSWSIPALNGFPGPYMKYVANWFTSQDFLNLISDKSDRSISFTETITYIDSQQVKLFSKEFHGKLVEVPRGTGNSIENVAEFEGVTLGERRQQGGVSHRPEDYIWVEFAKWFSSTKLQ